MNLTEYTRFVADMSVTQNKPSLTKQQPSFLYVVENREAKGPFRRYSHGAPDLHRGTFKAVLTSQSLDPNNPFSCDPRAWDSTLTACRELTAKIEDRLRLPAPGWSRRDWINFSNWQLDHLKKLTLQVNARPYWYAEEKEFSNESALPNDYERAALAVGEFAAHGLTREKANAFIHGYRRGSNHGWPDMSSSDVSLMAHAALAVEYMRRYKRGAATIEEGRNRLQDFSSELRLPQDFGVVVFKRQGPRIKPLPMTQIWPDGRVTSEGETTSLFSRSRLVFGVSAFVNIVCFQTYPALAAAISNCGMWHDAMRDIDSDLGSLAAKYKFSYNDDISQYDHSFSLKKLEVVGRCCFNRVAREAGFRESGLEMAAVDTFPLISPGSGPGYVAYHHHVGGLCSGRNDTTFVGVMGNLIRLLILSHRFFGVPYTPAGFSSIIDGSGPIAVRVWGDDTVVFSNSEINPTEWNQASLELVGCPTEISEGPIFLMGFNHEGHQIPSVGRMFQQRVANEHPYPGPLAVRAGCINALNLLVNNPFRREFFDSLRETYPAAFNELRADEIQDLAAEYGGKARGTLEAAIRREGAPSFNAPFYRYVLNLLGPEAPPKVEGWLNSSLFIDGSLASVDDSDFKRALSYFREQYLDPSDAGPRRITF